MSLTQEQANRLATMIKPCVVLEYINNNRSDYEEWLKKENKRKQLNKEEFLNANKICKIKRKQTAND